MPGLAMGISALVKGTKEVLVDSDLLGGASILLGKSTNEAVYNGALCSHISLIEKVFLGHCKEQRNQKCTLILTGGDADSLSRHLEPSHLVMSELVFRGLQLSFSIGN